MDYEIVEVSGTMEGEVETMQNALAEKTPISEEEMQEILSSVIEQMKEAHQQIEVMQAETARLTEEAKPIRAETELRIEELRRFVASFEGRS